MYIKQQVIAQLAKWMNLFLRLRYAIEHMQHGGEASRWWCCWTNFWAHILCSWKFLHCSERRRCKRQLVIQMHKMCEYKLVSVNNKSRSNLKNHVRSKHYQSFEKLVQQCQQADKHKRPSTDDSIAVVKGINTYLLTNY